MKNLLLTAATGVMMASAAMADMPVGTITIWNQYDASSGGTIPGVKVRMNHAGDLGSTTIYRVGDKGLTRDIVFATDADAREDWARINLGLELMGATYSPGENPN